MTYQITAYCKGRRIMRKAFGVRALHNSLTALRDQGYVVADITSRRPVVR